MKINHHISRKQKRTLRIRGKVRGTAERPRLNVFRSNKSIYLQVINDEIGRTVLSASSVTEKKVAGLPKMEQSKAVATALSEKLKKANITKLVFDRGAYRYHGRVKAVAEVMREKGIEV